MLTGFGDEMQQVDERPPGVDCVLGKPVDTQKLRGAIARAWSEHELHMQESRDGALPLIRDVATDEFSI
jgi:FixJ family two-component response regulator